MQRSRRSAPRRSDRHTSPRSDRPPQPPRPCHASPAGGPRRTSSTRPVSRSRICAWTVASSAVVGSSARMHAGSCGQRGGDGGALLETARELVGVGVGAPSAGRRYRSAPGATRSRHGPHVPRRPRWTVTTSSIWLPMVTTGLRLPPGSWKTRPMPAAADRGAFLLGQVEERAALEAYRALDDGGLGQQTGQGQQRGRLLPEPLSPMSDSDLASPRRRGRCRRRRASSRACPSPPGPEADAQSTRLCEVAGAAQIAAIDQRALVGARRAPRRVADAG